MLHVCCHTGLHFFFYPTHLQNSMNDPSPPPPIFNIWIFMFITFISLKIIPLWLCTNLHTWQSWYNWELWHTYEGERKSSYADYGGVVPQQWNRACIRFNFSWYIVSFQINLHWISNSGLRKVVQMYTHFMNWPGKLMKGVLFHQDNAPADKSVVAMAVVHNCGFKLVDHLHIFLIWHHLTIFCSPTKKTHTLAGKRYWTDMMGHICSWKHFRGSGWELLYHRNWKAVTPMEEVCGPHGRLCGRIGHIWSNSTIAS